MLFRQITHTKHQLMNNKQHAEMEGLEIGSVAQSTHKMEAEFPAHPISCFRKVKNLAQWHNI